ncbi:hypothetical protein [Streptomyces sp. NPDC097981]|uniref:hypothetical protein n=1 Tax=Streptomyces sp. NPDC097981 TaxID=3155428 RepID=UPI00332951C4
MFDFRRPPEWDQQASRHSELVDPVITVRQLGMFEAVRRTAIRVDCAAVFVTPMGTLDVYLPPNRPGSMRYYTAVYEVDMGVHPARAEIRLPSDNDALEFGVEVELLWQVKDPARFVGSGCRDVPKMLLGELEQAARPVARGFAIEQSGAAERQLIEAVRALGAFGQEEGLHVSWTVRLRRDQANIDHQNRLQAISHQAAEAILTAKVGGEVDAQVDARGRQQDALMAARALEHGRLQQELEVQRQHWEQEQELLRGRYEIERQQFESQKIAFYQHHLEQGGVQQWALHLARHPEDSALVMNSMREDQLRLIQAQMGLVGQLLGADGAEDFELEGPKRLALQAVNDILTQRLPGVPAVQDPRQLYMNPPPGEPADPADQPGAAAPTDAAPQVPAVPPMPPGPPLPPMPTAPPQAQVQVPPYAGPPSVFPAWQPPPGYGQAPVRPVDGEDEDEEPADGEPR